MFNELCQLFGRKYDEQGELYAEMCSFINFYFQKTNSWFEGMSTKCPSTNNGLESTNSWIKRHHTFGQRMPLNQFVEAMMRMVSEKNAQQSKLCCFLFGS